MTLRDKYSPSRASEFIGNTASRKIVNNLLQREVKKFVFSGPAGVGKRTMARLIARNKYGTEREAVFITQEDALQDVHPDPKVLSLVFLDRFPATFVDRVNNDDEGVWAFFVEEDMPDFAKPFAIVDAAPVYLGPITTAEVRERLEHVVAEEGFDVQPTVLSQIAVDSGGRLGVAYSLLESAVGLDATEYFQAVRGVQPLRDMDVGGFADALIDGDWRAATRTLKPALDACDGNWHTLLDGTIMCLTGKLEMKADLDIPTDRIAETLSLLLKVAGDDFVPSDRERVITVCGMFLASHGRGRGS